MDALKDSLEKIDMYKDKIANLELSEEEQSEFDVYNAAIPEFIEARNKVIELGMKNKNEEAYQLYAEEVMAKKN